MRIVIAANHFSSFGGTPSYMVTVAEQLERLGHAVVLHALELGEMAEAARARGLQVAAQDELPDGCDAVLAQDSVAAFSLAERYPNVPQLFVSHGYMHDLQLPPPVEGIVGAAVALNDRTLSRLKAAGGSYPVHRLRQPVDLERFRPVGPVRAEAETVLLLGNYLRGTRAESVERACKRANLKVVQVGRHGKAHADPHGAIAEADIVVGYGRSIVEAMASARAAFVYDHQGGDGWVTPDTYSAIEADGFNGQAFDRILDERSVEQLLGEYDPQLALLSHDLARRHHDAARHAEELVTALEGLPSTDRPVDDLPLAELARLTRRGWQLESKLADLTLASSIALEGEQRVSVEVREDASRTIQEWRERASYAEELLARHEATRTWRWTAPLRRLGSRIRHQPASRDRAAQG